MKFTNELKGYVYNLDDVESYECNVVVNWEADIEYSSYGIKDFQVFIIDVQVEIFNDEDYSKIDIDFNSFKIVNDIEINFPLCFSEAEIHIDEKTIVIY